MNIFDMEFKRRAFGLRSPMSWAFKKAGEVVVVNKMGYLFLVLFCVTFLSFAFLTFYMSQCITPPIVDAAKIGQGMELDFSHELSPYICDSTFDSIQEIRCYLELKGIFDPNQQFSAHLGFSHNYPNYIKSIPYKFT